MDMREQRGCHKIAPFRHIVARVNSWVEAVLNEVAQFHDVTHTDIRRVENVGYDGFIPFTEGGVDGIAYGSLEHMYGSGGGPRRMRDILETMFKDVQEAWDREHPETPYAILFMRDDPDQLLLPEHPPRPEPYETQREAFYELEQRYLSEGGTYFYKVRALFYDKGNIRNETGEAEVLFCVGYNDDLEYGRDSISWLPSPANGGPGTHWLWERTVTVRALERLKTWQCLVDAAVEALSDA